MSRVAIVSDTTAYIPTEVAEANGIRLVSLYVNFGGERTEREADIRDYDRFYEELRTADSLPTTSQPSVGDFIAVYEPLLAEGKDVVSIHIAGGLSGTPEAARQAKEALERDGRGGERVHVIDSRTAAGGLGLVAVAAARRAAAGETADSVVATANAARDELKMWFAIDTLEFLKRSGRIGAASAWIGSTLRVKPILSVESEITPVERVRTSQRMFERMVDYARQRHDSGADGWVVQHIQAPEQGDLLAERCREVFGYEPLFCSEIGPVLGAHTGPGLLGVGSIPTRFLV
ncbi:MAG: fatty acid kinase fatty acid binding subunit [Thermoleophilaceae bacterium]|nr:fatty acid kinase fatty acid binding subunit [Thermoleophilaceae bacterium]